jgi:hypothetical protein
MEKINALRVVTEKPQSLAVGRTAPCHESPKTLTECVVVCEAEEDKQRFVAVARLECAQSMPRRLIGHQHRYTGYDGKGTALAAEHTHVDAVRIVGQSVVLDNRDGSPAEGAAQDVQETQVHVFGAPRQSTFRYM